MRCWILACFALGCGPSGPAQSPTPEPAPTPAPAFVGQRTLDVLPAGPTGAYWAHGVALGSSFRVGR